MAKRNKPAKSAQDPAPAANPAPVEPPAEVSDELAEHVEAVGAYAPEIEPVESGDSPEPFDEDPDHPESDPAPHPAIKIARAYQTGAGAFADVPGARYCIPPPPVIKPSR